MPPDLIVVAGESLIDVLLAPDGSIAMALGGGPYNTARTIARLGGHSAFLGRLGTDRLGQRLRAGLLDDGVDLSLAVTTDDPTTLAMAELDPAGVATYRFYIEGTSAPGLRAADLPEPFPAAFALHIGTLGLALDPIAATLEGLLGRLAAATLVMVDPNCRPSVVTDPAAFRARIGRVVARAHVVKVSTDDLAFLAPDLSARAAARRIAEAGPAVVLVTEGGSGVGIVSATRDETIDVPPARVVDTVGAGDAFGGGFLATWQRTGRHVAELADPAAVREVVGVAVEVARRTVERPGADPPTLAELEGPDPR